MISVLFIGDIVGYSGLQFLLQSFDELKLRYSPNCIIVNGENIVNGKGLSEKEANLLFEAGVNVITTGNHVWENWLARPLLSSNAHVLRPLNYPQGNPGRGFTQITLNNGLTIGVVQLQGRTYMQPIDCPFRAADFAMSKLQGCNAVIVDFHAEATAEKAAMGWHLDGRASAVLGTHTHVQTADAQILPQGTAYITDVGMTGPYDSVLGLRKDIALKRMILQTAHKYEQADTQNRVCGVFVMIDVETKTSVKIESFAYPTFESTR